jgi:hypothetical protein
MKLSNFLLTFVAAALVVATTVGVMKMTDISPTAVISIPREDAVKGGGFSLEVPKNLSARQTHLLALAYEIAKHDGHKYPQLLQGIILQETKAGGIAGYKVAGQSLGLGVNQRYYGVAQIKLAAAQDVLNRYPGLRGEFNFHTSTDEEVIAKLIENDRFNLSVASKYLLILKSYGYDTINQLALAYNQGPGGAKNLDANEHDYSVKVMKHIQGLPTQKVMAKTK